MCNERGGVVDDLYAYRLSAEVYLLIINASRIETDVAWLLAQAATFSRPNELQSPMRRTITPPWRCRARASGNSSGSALRAIRIARRGPAA